MPAKACHLSLAPCARSVTIEIMTVPASPNQRSAERVKVSAFVRVLARGDTKEFVFRTRDMSTSGLFLATRVVKMYPFKVGTVLDVELYDDHESVSCRAEVVRVVAEETPPTTADSDQPNCGFGVRIVDCPPQDMARLGTWIARSRTGR